MAAFDVPEPGETENFQKEKINSSSSFRQMYESLIDSMKDYAIFILNPQGQIMTWSSPAKEILGYDKQEIIGKNFSIFHVEADEGLRGTVYSLKIAEEEGKHEEECTSDHWLVVDYKNSLAVRRFIHEY